MREYNLNQILLHDEHIGAQLYTVKGNNPLHRHNFVEFIYVRDGSGIQEIDGVSYEVKRGDFLFVNYGKTHGIYPKDFLTYYEVMFDLEFISHELINRNNAFDILTISSFENFDSEINESTAPIVTFVGDEMYTIEHILKDLVNELSFKPALYKNVIHGYLETLFSKLMRKLSYHLPDGLGEQKQDVLFKIMEYINKNFSEDISLEALAEQSFYNPSYFSRIFKERFGMGFKTYVTKLRTDKAAELLKSTELPIKDVMTECGFNDKNAFYRAVERWYNSTPSRLREFQRKENK